MTDDTLERRQTALEWLETSPAAANLTAPTRANVQHWLNSSAYAATWPRLLELLEARDTNELTRLFWERIPFGTGGRRGPMADLGSATINRRTLAESAAGLGQYVLEQRAENGTSATAAPRAVIAFDSRLRSPEFAQVTACVLAAAGFQVFLYHEPRATPQLSFSVRRLECDCGVMISASHNPPADNGFKAYWSDGGQILSPHDRGIIACVDQVDDIPLVDFDSALSLRQIQWVDRALDDEYVAAVRQLARSENRDLSVLYTPLHGVGETSVARVLRESGFDGLEIFEPQRSMDGHFPNVPDHLPNPERTAVFGPAISYAETRGHDLILASDPDADRIAVAVRTREGRYACLTGNQLGALLADFAVSHPDHLPPDGYLLHTLVTTPLISRIAKGAGLRAISDLPVGFKHIGAAMERLGAASLVFAAEESLGYLAGEYCRDKDAAVGGLWCAELAAELKARGQTLLDRLHQLYVRHGWHRESQLSRTYPGPEGASRISRLIESFRQQPPEMLGAARVDRLRDYGRQQARYLRSRHVVETLSVNAGDLLFADVSFEGVQGQVALRPSGTEPKIKCYFFVQAPAAMPPHEGEQRSLGLLKELEGGLQEWMASHL